MSSPPRRLSSGQDENNGCSELADVDKAPITHILVKSLDSEDGITASELPDKAKESSDNMPVYSGILTRPFISNSPLTANSYLPAIHTIAKAFHTSVELIKLTVTIYMVFQGIRPSYVMGHFIRPTRSPTSPSSLFDAPVLYWLSFQQIYTGFFSFSDAFKLSALQI
ncbi:hypothetical protein M422DRAFT_42760 [Sphaerobolus stellatus SS14]|nr:hypothetical protein M422DRAFT_42760 [Sphaerobolus stellatus SS14]